MLKRHNEFFKSLLRLNDLLAVSLAWWLAYGLRFHTDLFSGREDYLPRHYLGAWLLILIVWGVVFELLDLYRPRRLSTYGREIIDLVKGSALALLILLGLLFLIREIILSRLVVMLFWFSSLLFLNVSHITSARGTAILPAPGLQPSPPACRRNARAVSPADAKTSTQTAIWASASSANFWLMTAPMIPAKAESRSSGTRLSY